MGRTASALLWRNWLYTVSRFQPVSLVSLESWLTTTCLHDCVRGYIWGNLESCGMLTTLRWWNCPHNEMKRKQNSFQTVLKRSWNCVLKLVCFSFISLCGQCQGCSRLYHCSGVLPYADLSNFERRRHHSSEVLCARSVSALQGRI